MSKAEEGIVLRDNGGDRNRVRVGAVFANTNHDWGVGDSRLCILVGQKPSVNVTDDRVVSLTYDEACRLFVWLNGVIQDNKKARLPSGEKDEKKEKVLPAGKINRRLLPGSPG